MKLFKVGDIIIIAVLIAFSFLSAILIFVVRDGDSKTLMVTVEGKLVKQIAMSNETSNKIYEFKFQDNTGYIEIKDGAVRMLEMNRDICPEAICSDTGWISKGYESIICLPNKIVVSFENAQSDSVDGILQ
jgi:hypothetical protein